ncbi:hypothetical protein SASPL_107201 [Salvia splendens]|uniref:PIR2-like helical domain-containing protein n=1 Tax=Salvia splendens TaxID=180675 RepID=A0A8X8YD02_SALSN|nr:hypothetical protein SASPL_107201 [Salvia splendens]
MSENCSVCDCSVDYGSNGVSSLSANDKDKLQGSDWDNPVVCQLEELLLNSLKVIFSSEVKKIIESGYTKEVAEWAILHSSLFNGGKDAVSNVVDSALSILKRDKDISMMKHPVFEGLESLVDYTLLEMICVLREIWPSLSVSEAMWCLLISDLNLVNTCPAEGGTVGGSCSQEASGESQALPKPKSETSSTSQIKDSNDLGSSKQINPPSGGELASPGKVCSCCSRSEGELIELCEGAFSEFVSREYQWVIRKGYRLIPREICFDKRRFSLRSITKVVRLRELKAKVAAWGSMVLDKSLRAPPGCATIAMKGAVHSKLPTPAGTAAEKNSHPSSNSPPLSSACDASKGGANCVPQDDKDEAIVTLVPYKQKIEKELQGWTEWANEKVMQAARRLGKDQAELKMLRQEKEQMEKFKKEKQTLLEENHLLKNDMLAAKMQAIRAVTNLESALEREQQTLKKLQSLEADKSIVQDELTNLQRQITSLNKRLEKARGRKDQFKAWHDLYFCLINSFRALWKQEEKEKSKAQKNIDSLKSKLDEEEALMKVEADSIKQASEKEMQRYSSYMTGLPGSEPPKVTNGFAVFQDNVSDSPDVKPERECVMCMTDEISVVFIPCAHQVLCTQCNMIHEKQGMSDCHSCRTTIQKRTGIGKALKRNVEEFLAEKFGISESEAQDMNRELFRTYGSSLVGLRDSGYDINPDDYHR